MKIIKGNYYKLTNIHGVEYIFQAVSKEDNGWIIDIVRTSDDKLDLSTNAFYVTKSDGTTVCGDIITKLSDSEILAIKI